MTLPSSNVVKTPPAPLLRGTGWMLAASLSFAAMAACAQLYRAELPMADLLFFRNIPGAVVIWIWALYKGRSCQTPHWRLHISCSTWGTLAALCYFYGVFALPLSTAMSLNYTMPVFLTLLMWSTLPRYQRSSILSMLAFSVIGVLGILQPEFHTTQKLALGAALLSGFLDAVVYQKMHVLSARGEPAWRSALYLSLLIAFYALLALWFYEGRWPHLSMASLPGIIGLAGFGLVARLCVANAFERGHPTIMGAFSYAAVLFSALMDIGIFLKPVNYVQIAGMAVLIGAGIALTIVLRKLTGPAHTAE